MITYKNLIFACDGAEKDGSPKCGISISNEFWYADKNTVQVSHRDLINPIVRIYKHGSYVQVDLDFGSDTNPELAICWNLLESMKDISMESAEDGKVPVTTLSIIPLQYEGEYSILCLGAIFWTLQPLRPGMKPAVIRMIFDADDFIAQHVAPESIAQIDYMDDIEANKAQTLSDIEQYRAAMSGTRVVEEKPVESVEKVEPKVEAPVEDEIEYEDEDSDGF